MARRKKAVYPVFLCCVVLSAMLWCPSVTAQQAPSRYALVIGGIGGAPEYTEQYRNFLFETRRALEERFMFPSEHITVLGESPVEDVPYLDDVSTAENITAACERLAEEATALDDVLIILFGHGSYDGQNAMLNIPRRDLKDAEYAELVDRIDARRIVFINTASCSAPFIAHLSAINRIVITATRSATQRNETVFPEFLVEALTTDAADRDKNGDLSVLEVFYHAADQTMRFYTDSGHLATEHPLIDDTGDRQGTRVEELAESTEGEYAGTSYLLDRSSAIAAAMAESGDEALAGLFAEQLEINREIASLRERRDTYGEDEYFALLEPLMVRLARLTAEIEDRQQE